MVFLAGMSWWLIISAILGLAAFIPIMWMYLMHDYQRMRVLTLLDPEKDPLGQVITFCNLKLPSVQAVYLERDGCKEHNPN